MSFGGGGNEILCRGWWRVYIYAVGNWRPVAVLSEGHKEKMTALYPSLRRMYSISSSGDGGPRLDRCSGIVVSIVKASIKEVRWYAGEGISSSLSLISAVKRNCGIWYE